MKKTSPKKTTPKKAIVKKDEEEESNADDEEGDDSDGDDEDDEEEGEELKPGLLERPVVLEKGTKRATVKTQRLEIAPTPSPREKKLDIPDGRGVKLGDIPRVEYFINKVHSEDVKLLHRLLYGRVGSLFELKRNVRKFTGFAFEKDDKEYDKKIQIMCKYTLPLLHHFCDILDLEKRGTKDDKIERILEFLLNPQDSGKPLPKSKRKKSGSKKKGTKRKRKTKAEGDDKKPKKKKKKVVAETEGDNVSDSDSDVAASDSSESESEDESPPKKVKKNTPKKTPQKASPKKKKVVAKSSPKKETKKSPKKEAKKSPKKAVKKATPQKKKKKVVEVEVSSDSSSDDEEPLAKKKKSKPTNSELRMLIKKLLDGADLETVTMKNVCRQVYEKYPDFDLSDRKDFIKGTVKQVIR